MRSSPPLATSQSFTVLSLLPDASSFPSGENTTDLTLECSLSVRSARPLATSQSLMVWSSLPEASMCPSGENATDSTTLECPLRVRSSRPLATSQSLIVLSLLPEASSFPSGENATEVSHPECALRVRNSRPLATSQSLTVLSQLPEASSFPFGENATEATEVECPSCGNILGLFWACTDPRHAHRTARMANVRLIIVPLPRDECLLPGLHFPPGQGETSFHLSQREFLSVRLDRWILRVLEFALGEVGNFVIDKVCKP